MGRSRFSVGSGALAALFLAVFAARGHAETTATVPSRAKIGAETERGIDATKLRAFVDGLLAEKVKQAQQEMAELQKKWEEERKVQEAEERERRRREDQANAAHGGLLVRPREVVESRPQYKVRADLGVPEVAAYKEIIRALTHQTAVCRGAIAYLSGLDRDNDEKLMGEEYKKAGALMRSTSRATETLDRNGDGQVTPREAESMLVLPRDVKRAADDGLAGIKGEEYRVPTFDADKDGALDLNERKRLTMAYAAAAIVAEQDLAFYQTLVESLTEAQVRASAEFARLVQR